MNSESLSLPSWVYQNEEFFQLEQDTVFKNGWHFVCHISDLPNIGSYVTYKVGDESIVVLRNENKELNAFYNVCRHRASRLLDGDAGTCERRIKCPYHAWAYDYSGNMLGAPNIKEYPELDKATHGLFPVELEQYLGFVFIRLKPGGESIAQLMAPVHEEFSAYNTQELEPYGEISEVSYPANWKAAVDNFLDGIHVRFAHPGLNNLIGEEYKTELIGQVYRAEGPINYKADVNSVVKRYSEILPEVSYLPEKLRSLWIYYFIWPNTAFCIYPDKIEMCQYIPDGPDAYKLRFRAYAMPDARPEMTEARALADKINAKTQEEDDELLVRIQEGMRTEPYSQALLGQQEVLLRGFVKEFREKVPVSTLTKPPRPGELAATNHELLKLISE